MISKLSENSVCFAINRSVPIPFEMVQAIQTVELVKHLHGSQDRTATFWRKFLNDLGLQAVRFKTIIVDKELSLRICRLWELPRLKRRFDAELFLRAAGREVMPFRSLFSFRNWLNSTFNLLYLIKIQEHGKQQILGFIGFYGLRAEDCLWMSLAIFDTNDRRRGYGARAVQLVTDFLQHETAIKRVFVEVAKRNYAALSFFQTCCFRLIGESLTHRPRTLYEDTPGLWSK